MVLTGSVDSLECVGPAGLISVAVPFILDGAFACVRRPCCGGHSDHFFRQTTFQGLGDKKPTVGPLPECLNAFPTGLYQMMLDEHVWSLPISTR